MKNIAFHKKEYKQLPDRAEDGFGYVYLIDVEGKTKIGMSRRPRGRISTLRWQFNGSNADFYVSDLIADYKETEKELLNLFKHKNIGGEWVAASADEIKQTAAHICVMRPDDQIVKVGYEGSEDYSLSEVHQMLINDLIDNGLFYFGLAESSRHAKELIQFAEDDAPRYVPDEVLHCYGLKKKFIRIKNSVPKIVYTKKHTPDLRKCTTHYEDK